MDAQHHLPKAPSRLAPSRSVARSSTLRTLKSCLWTCEKKKREILYSIFFIVIIYRTLRSLYIIIDLTFFVFWFFFCGFGLKVFPILVS